MVQLRVGEGCHEKDLETHIYKPVGVKMNFMEAYTTVVYLLIIRL